MRKEWPVALNVPAEKNVTRHYRKKHQSPQLRKRLASCWFPPRRPRLQPEAPLNVAVRKCTSPVSGSVQPCPDHMAEGIRNIVLGSQVRPFQITARHTYAAH